VIKRTAKIGEKPGKKAVRTNFKESDDETESKYRTRNKELRSGGAHKNIDQLTNDERRIVKILYLKQKPWIKNMTLMSDS
jgi:hypothetical protein